MKPYIFMKNFKYSGLLAVLALVGRVGLAQEPYTAAPPPAQAAPVQANLSPGAAEVVRLAQSGVSEDVVLAYVQNSQSTFNLSADDVVYLRDVGLSSPVITSMINHDNALRGQQPQYSPPPATPVPTEPPSTAPVEAPLVPSTGPDYVANPPADVTYFYDDLSPYGAWVSLEGYGWCWQPLVVVANHSWRPYCDGGHWVYTDAGWFWQSDYTWGWAPFHYGRWFSHPRCGWVWAPDRVWGPSWVVWRTSGDYCGWAPVPPHAVFDAHVGWVFNGVHVGFNFDFGLHADHFTFVGFHDFCEHDLGGRRLHATEVTRIYNHTTIINNYTVNNTTIVNHGVPVERVAAVSHVAVPRATVRTVSDTTIRSGGARHGSEGGTAVVYRPERLAAPPVHHAPATMVAQRVDAQHPVVVHHDPVVRNTATITSGGRGVPAGAISRPSTVPRGSPPPASAPARPATPATPGRAPSAQVTPLPTHQNAPTASVPRSSQPAQAPVSRSTPQTAPLVPPRESQTRSLTETRPAPHEAAPVTRAEPSVRQQAPVAMPRSEASRPAVQPQPSYNAAREMPAQNPHVYYPKSYPQSPGVRSQPQPTRDTAPPPKAQSSPATPSQKNQQ